MASWISWTSGNGSPTSTAATSIDDSTDSFCADSAWYYWNSHSSTTDSFTATWNYWSSGTGRTVIVTPILAARDPKDLERFRTIQAERLAREKKLAEEREDAEKRAKELLLDLIGEEELKIYEETGRILVKGREYDYILYSTGTVRRLEKDKMSDLCIHLVEKEKYPMTDNLIALKLLAEANEKEFNRLANVHRINDRPEELPKMACARRNN